MCAECGMNPCHPRCPNAPEPVPVHECVKCGYGILAGDKFWDSPEDSVGTAGIYDTDVFSNVDKLTRFDCEL